MINNEMLACAKQGKLKLQDITASELQELVEQKDTRKYGLDIIGQACIDAISLSVAAKVDGTNINNKANQMLIQELSDTVYVKNGKITVNKAKAAEHFSQYLFSYVDVLIQPDGSNKSVHINWKNIVKGMFHVPSTIKIIKYDNRIINQVDYMNGKYLGDGEYSLTLKIQKSVEKILKEAQVNNHFFDRMRYMETDRGKEEFFMCAMEGEMELPALFSEYEKDAEKLKALMKKQQRYLSKRRNGICKKKKIGKSL